MQSDQEPEKVFPMQHVWPKERRRTAYFRSQPSARWCQDDELIGLKLETVSFREIRSKSFCSIAYPLTRHADTS
jgi:hypothetical protein